MSIGATIRHSFGPYERQVAELYRGMFVNLEDLAGKIRTWSAPQRVLEIGCGEGALAERVARDFPQSDYLGIDIISHLGRMYAGPEHNVSFRQVTAQDLAIEQPHRFDLILINDVLHHVPDDLRAEILDAARRLLAPRGSLIFKDWVRRVSPIHALCYFADAYIGGDKTVRYMPLGEQRDLIARVFGEGAIAAEATIKPWRHNRAFLIRQP